jgi:hypothetical protein
VAGTCIYDENHRDAALIPHDERIVVILLFLRRLHGEKQTTGSSWRSGGKRTTRSTPTPDSARAFKGFDVDTDILGAASAEEFAAILSAPDG